jgi:hypothetical protein
MKIAPLPEASLSFKVLASLLLLTVGLGYVFGLINIYNNTGFSYTGLVSTYRGDVKEMTVPLEFAFAKLIHEHHVHVFGISMLFFLVGAIFILTELPESVKAVLVAVPFLGMLLDFTSFWLLVFVSPLFGLLAMTFGGVMAFSFFLIIGRPLYEMWVKPIWHRIWGEGKIPWFLR